jgi:hypothetical protein
MCWGISLGHANNIASENKTLNFYFENENYNTEIIKSIKEADPELAIVGWAEEALQSANNPDLGKTASDLDVLIVKGSSNLLVKGSNLFTDDLEGCLIDSDTSYKLFGSSNCVGREIVYNDRTLIVRGILKGCKANIMIQASEGETITAAADGKVNGIYYDAQFGNCVQVDLGNGYELTYGQLGNIDLKEGDYMKVGDVIGTVAAPTKYFSVEGTNVYFKLTLNGEPVDPLNTMS